MRHGRSAPSSICARHFTSEAMAARTLAVYQEICCAPAAPGLGRGVSSAGLDASKPGASASW